MPDPDHPLTTSDRHAPAGLARAGDPDSTVAQALERLLNHHRQVADQSLLFASAVPGPRDRTEVARHVSADLGPPRDALRRLAASPSPQPVCDHAAGRHGSP